MTILLIVAGGLILFFMFAVLAAFTRELLLPAKRHAELEKKGMAVVAVEEYRVERRAA
jgi:hypothetical protein